MSSEERDPRPGAKKPAAGKAAAAKAPGAGKRAKKKAARKKAGERAKPAAGKKAPGKTATGKSAPAKSAPEKSAPGEKPAGKPPGKKVERLPAFGFAEDLLRELKGKGAAGESGEPDAKPSGPRSSAPRSSEPRPSGPRPSEPRPNAPRSGASKPAPLSPDAAGESGSAADPERIFAFADTLEAEAPEEPETVPARITSWVTFDLAGEIYALPVEPVREVLRVSSVTRVPHAPRPIRGVTNLRGRVIPVIDLRVRIGLEGTAIERSTRVIVVASRGRLLGLLVDAVHQVVHIDLNRVQPPPDDVMTVQSDYISGVVHLGEQLILLLDVDRALVVRDDPQAEEPPRQSGAA